MTLEQSVDYFSILGGVEENIEIGFFDDIFSMVKTNFVDEFKNSGMIQFGSGWAWLLLDAGKLKIVKTANADTPLAHNLKPLLTVDVWEHAYYLDFQNRRPDYLTTFIEKLINWEFVEMQLSS